MSLGYIRKGIAVVCRTLLLERRRVPAGIAAHLAYYHGFVTRVRDEINGFHYYHDSDFDKVYASNFIV